MLIDPNSCRTGGNTNTSRPNLRASLSTRLSKPLPALGIAISTAEALLASATTPSSVRSPATATPEIRSFDLVGSSSSRATGTNGLSASDNNVRTMLVAASPAPITIKRRALEPSGRRLLSTYDRHADRAATWPSKLIIAASIGTDRGTERSHQSAIDMITPSTAAVPAITRTSSKLP